MRVVWPVPDFSGSITITFAPPAPEQHVGWVWLIGMREGDETAEDAWIAEEPREAIAKSQAKYPDAKLAWCHRRNEVTNRSIFRFNLDGSLYD